MGNTKVDSVDDLNNRERSWRWLSCLKLGSQPKKKQKEDLKVEGILLGDLGGPREKSWGGYDADIYKHI